MTNTFHGTIFTVLFEKQAVFNSDGKKKIKELLKTCQLEELDCYEKMDELDDLFNSKDIDYEAVCERIDALRCESRHYLEKL